MYTRIKRPANKVACPAQGQTGAVYMMIM